MLNGENPQSSVEPSTTAALSLKGPNLLAIPSDYVACFGSRDAAFSISTGSSYVSAAVVLWRTINYEEVYLAEYATPREARMGLSEYISFYNHERLHQALEYRTPAEVYR